MLFLGGRLRGRCTEFLGLQQRLPLVVERPAIGLHIVKPNMICAAGVGFGKEQDGR